ncbi:MAG: hypothetical protein FJ004_12250 [Chloroflexi bacterium]|nr:hypothetical protein [Chloroflexota bacterium]
MSEKAMKQGFGALIILLVLAIAFYFFPEIQGLNRRVNELANTVTELTSDRIQMSATITAQSASIEEQRTAIDRMESETSQLKSELVTANTNIETYKSQIANLESSISTLRTQVSTAQSEATGLQKRLDNILGINVIQHYEWLKTFSWDLIIPLSLYVEYKERPRPLSFSSWVNMAKDPKDDAYIDEMVKYVDEMAARYNYNEQQKINFVVTFVQSLPYTVDSVTTPANEYPRYPIETLFDRGGDCEDTSILTAALLDRMGYDVALIELPKHMAVGVAVNAFGRYYTYGGKRYFYLETTGEGWKIGEMPNEYLNAPAYIYPLR